MSTQLPPDVPIIGRPQMALIPDVRIVTPNSVEVSDNGLDCGQAIGHIRITNPLMGKQWRVPVTANQVQELLAQLTQLWSAPLPTNTQEAGQHGKH